MKKDPNTGLLILAFATIYVVWGTTYLAMRVAVETIPPFMMAGVRFLLAGSVTFLFLKFRGVATPGFDQWKQGAIVGLFLMVGGNGLVSWAEQEIPSGIAALVVASMPIWMCIFDWLIFKGSRPGGFTAIGLVLGFVGMGILFAPSFSSGAASSLDLFSLFVLVFAPVFWSLGSLYSRAANLPSNVFMSAAIQSMSGGLVLLLTSIVMGEWWKLDLDQVSVNSILAMLYLAIFGSIIALSTYVWLLKQVSPSRVSTYTYVNPIIAVLLGWLILDETITGQTIFAICVIVGSVVMVVVSRSKPQPAAATDETKIPVETDHVEIRKKLVETKDVLDKQCKA